MKTAGGRRNPRKTVVLPYSQEAREEGWGDSGQAVCSAHPCPTRSWIDHAIEAMTLISREPGVSWRGKAAYTTKPPRVWRAPQQGLQIGVIAPDPACSTGCFKPLCGLAGTVNLPPAVSYKGAQMLFSSGHSRERSG